MSEPGYCTRCGRDFSEHLDHAFSAVPFGCEVAVHLASHITTGLDVIEHAPPGPVGLTAAQREQVRAEMARCREAEHYLLADEERRKLTGDALMAEAELHEMTKRAEESERQRDELLVSFVRTQGAFSDAGSVIVPDAPEDTESSRELTKERDEARALAQRNFEYGRSRDKETVTLERDRDEWRTQHENAVASWRSESAHLVAQRDKARAEVASVKACNEALVVSHNISDASLDAARARLAEVEWQAGQMRQLAVEVIGTMCACDGPRCQETIDGAPCKRLSLPTGKAHAERVKRLERIEAAARIEAGRHDEEETPCEICAALADTSNPHGDGKNQ